MVGGGTTRMKSAPIRLTAGQIRPRKIMNFRASNSRVAVWKVARLENDDKTREDRPRSDRGTDSDRVG
jgi:hypothetical protein